MKKMMGMRAFRLPQRLTAGFAAIALTGSMAVALALGSAVAVPAVADAATTCPTGTITVTLGTLAVPDGIACVSVLPGTTAGDVTLNTSVFLGVGISGVVDVCFSTTTIPLNCVLATVVNGVLVANLEVPAGTVVTLDIELGGLLVGTVTITIPPILGTPVANPEVTAILLVIAASGLAMVEASRRRRKTVAA
jgi:hypothetical protein